MLTVRIQSRTDMVSFFLQSDLGTSSVRILVCHLVSTDRVMIASLDPHTSVRICHTCRSFSQLVNPRFLC